jgi:hypothetical protein
LTLLLEYSFSPKPKEFKRQTEIIANKLIELDNDSFNPEVFYHQNSYHDISCYDIDEDWAEDLFNRLLMFVVGNYMLGDSLYKLCLRMGAVIYEPTQHHKEGMVAERRRLFSKGCKKQ